jgi:hypothetical protein
MLNDQVTEDTQKRVRKEWIQGQDHLWETEKNPKALSYDDSP